MSDSHITPGGNATQWPAFIAVNEAVFEGSGVEQDKLDVNAPGMAAAIAPYLPSGLPVMPVFAIVTPGFPDTDVLMVSGGLNRLSTTNGDQNAVFPPAADHPNQMIGVKNVNTLGVVSLVPTGGDTIDGELSWPAFLNSPGGTILAISDGVSDWVLILDPSGS